MAKKAKVAEEKAPAVNEDSNERGAADIEETAPAPKKAKKTSFDVFNATGGFVRTYSVEAHGKEAKKLASEYAGKIKGEVR